MMKKNVFCVKTVSRKALVLTLALIMALMLGACKTEDGEPVPDAETDTVSPSSEPAVKTILTVGAIGGSMALDRAVERFNAENKSFEFRVADYLEYAVGDVYEAIGMMKIDITLGELDAVSLMSAYAQLFSGGGALVDLLPYVDDDIEVKSEDFVEGIFNAILTNGALYSFSPDYYIISAAGLTENVGSGSGITPETIVAARGEMPWRTAFFDGGLSRAEYLRYAYCVSDNKLVNISGGRFNFGSDEFLEILSFASRLPEAGEGVGAGDEGLSGVQAGTSILSVEIVDMLGQRPVQVGKVMTYTGIPMPEGMGIGSAAVPASAELGIPVTAEHKDASWQLLRRLLLEDGQFETAKERYAEEGATYIPLNKSALSRLAKEYIMPGGDFYDEENGALEASVEQNIALAEAVTIVYRDISDTERTCWSPVSEIIAEEAEHYFKGETDLEPMLRRIGLRVQNEYLVLFDYSEYPREKAS